MSDPKRATLITVGATKNVKNNVNKTVRLTINLDESNESKYPELNYKELVVATARKKHTENGKTEGLDPFSDNDDDVERVARKFEQKYGGKSTYGRKGRSKYDEFADIGAGYDENDSFIDNTDGYDEMIPPECDTLYGGFYINCGSLEFKTVPENVAAASDGDSNRNHVRNKRRISSSSSDDASSDSSSESDSQEPKATKAITNGDIDSHKIEHRKKKNKDVDKKKAKKVRRTDSSAATSGKQTSDDNGPGDAESADSRTSQSDSLTSKPAPSSENPITSDSSRDTEAKIEIKLPPLISQLLEEIETQSVYMKNNPKAADSFIDQYALRLQHTLNKANADKHLKRVAWGRASKVLHVPRARLLQRSRTLDAKTTSITSISSQVITAASTTVITVATTTTTEAVANSSLPTSKSTAATLNKAASAPTISKTNTSTIATKSVPSTTTVTKTTATSKRKADDKLKDLDVSQMSPEEKESKIVETLKKLKELIEERKPSMMSAYNAECERVQEERKKLAQYSAESGGPHIDKRLPKRRFPWCARSRSLLARLAHLAASPTDAAKLLQARALPLFPSGFVRMPTLLKQADLNKEAKASNVKFQRAPQVATTFPQLPVASTPQPFIEPIQFPSSLTVTTTVKPMDKGKSDDTSIPFTSIVNSFLPNKESSTDNMDEIVDKNKEDYIRPNSIGSITITPVRTEKKVNNSNEKNKEPLLRVKSPAALNEMVNKKEKQKKDKTINSVKEKSVDTPLHIDTGYQSKKESTQSPKNHEEISQKRIENMRIAENNIPRPGLVAKHSPTFAKPDKRPPDARKKKEVLIVSDMDPLADCPLEPLAVDDSSSDVEVIEEKLDTSEPKSDSKSDKVPSKDKVNDSTNHKNVNSVKQSKSVSSKDKECRTEKTDRTEHKMEESPDDMMTLLRNITEMGNSQKPQKLNCNSFGGVINNAKKESSKYNQPVFNPHSDKDKLAERASLNKMDGCNAITG